MINDILKTLDQEIKDLQILNKYLENKINSLTNQEEYFYSLLEKDKGCWKLIEKGMSLRYVIDYLVNRTKCPRCKGKCSNPDHTESECYLCDGSGFCEPQEAADYVYELEEEAKNYKHNYEVLHEARERVKKNASAGFKKHIEKNLGCIFDYVVNSYISKLEENSDEYYKLVQKLIIERDKLKLDNDNLLKTNTNLLCELDELHCDIASAFGWDMKGNSFTEAIRKTVYLAKAYKNILKKMPVKCEVWLEIISKLNRKEILEENILYEKENN